MATDRIFSLFFNIFELLLGVVLMNLGVIMTIMQAVKASSPLGAMLGVLFFLAGLTAAVASMRGLRDLCRD